MVDTTVMREPDEMPDFPAGPVLCVDLDGTLLHVDTLHETFLRAIRKSPSEALKALAVLKSGKAAFKRRISEIAPFDSSNAPFNQAFLDFLHTQRAAGRKLVLVSAADQSIVDKIAAQVGIFDLALGSDGEVNLSGNRKLAAIRERFGDDFVYAGNGSADLPIWEAARGAVVVGDGLRFANRVANKTKIEARFPNPPFFKPWFRALRPHQWAKNLLIFVPFFLAGPLIQPGDLSRVVMGFAVLCLLASSGYIINDLLDLDADRRHPTKRRRPFASGAISARTGFIAAASLILISLAGAAALDLGFAVIAAGYLAGTLSYSIFLKRIALLDVMTLAGLYTLRIRAGIALVASSYSYWIITFSIFIFLSLALLKRYAEFVDERLDEKSFELRGYSKIDVPLILGFGIACSVAAPLLFVIYLVEEKFPSKVYSSPEVLWLVMPVLLLWLMHMWREAVRGVVREDPVIFALKDKLSLFLGSVVVFLVATSW